MPLENWSVVQDGQERLTNWTNEQEHELTNVPARESARRPIEPSHNNRTRRKPVLPLKATAPPTPKASKEKAAN